MLELAMILEVLALGDYQSNCYIFGSETSKKGVIIDPGFKPEVIMKRVRDLDLDIECIILTHGHPDHTGAMKQVKASTGAPIAIHAADAPILRDKFLHSMLGFPFANVTPDRLLQDGGYHRGGRTGPQSAAYAGHTPGCICLLGEGFVFTGDTLFNMSIGRTDMPGGDPAPDTGQHSGKN